MNDTLKRELDKVVESINKKLKNKYAIVRASEAPKDIFTIHMLPTGCLALDYAMRTGGIPISGQHIEIYGPAGSCKSTLALVMVGQLMSQDKDAIVLWMDLEGSMADALDYLDVFGIDKDRFFVSPIKKGDVAIDCVIEFLSANDNVKLAVIDSIAALVPEKQLERSAGDEFTIGALSKFMSSAMPKLNNVCKSDPEHKKSIIWLNQIRTDIGKYGAPQMSSGGNAINHYMDVRIALKRTSNKDRQAYKHVEDGLLYSVPSSQNSNIEKTGYEVDGMIIKSKVSTAGASQNKFIFRYIANVGIDKQFDLMRTAMETGLLQVSGATNTINGDKYRGKEEMFKNILQYEDYIKKNINYSKAVFVSDNTCGSDEMVFIPDDDVSEELKIAA